MEAIEQKSARTRQERHWAEQRMREQMAADFLMTLPEPKGLAQASKWRLRRTVSPMALEAHRRANVENLKKMRQADMIRSMELDGPEWMAGA